MECLRTTDGIPACLPVSGSPAFFPVARPATTHADHRVDSRSTSAPIIASHGCSCVHLVRSDDRPAPMGFRIHGLSRDHRHPHGLFRATCAKRATLSFPRCEQLPAAKGGRLLRPRGLQALSTFGCSRGGKRDAFGGEVPPGLIRGKPTRDLMTALHLYSSHVLPCNVIWYAAQSPPRPANPDWGILGRTWRIHQKS